MCLNEIESFLGVLLWIISDRGPFLTSRFLKVFKTGLGAKVKRSTIFHTHADGLAERTIQTFEDTLRACVIDFKGNWADLQPLFEFSYNNSYHSNITMERFQDLD